MQGIWEISSFELLNRFFVDDELLRLWLEKPKFADSTSGGSPDV